MRKSLKAFLFQTFGTIQETSLPMKKHLQTQYTYPMFLNGNICKMYKHVIQFTCTWCIFYCAKPAKSKFIP